jgi:hypothetical protein
MRELTHATFYLENVFAFYKTTESNVQKTEGMDNYIQGVRDHKECRYEVVNSEEKKQKKWTLIYRVFASTKKVDMN